MYLSVYLLYKINIFTDMQDLKKLDASENLLRISSKVIFIADIL